AEAQGSLPGGGPASLEWFQRARRLHAGNSGELRNYARALWACGRRDEALRALEDARSLVPDDEETLDLLAEWRASTGKSEEACSLLAEGLANGWDDQLCSKLASWIGKVDEPRSTIERIASLESKLDEAAAWDAWAAVLAAAGKREAAVVACEKAMAQDPSF